MNGHCDRGASGYFLTTALLAAGACIQAVDENGPSVATVRDSAGITIVENRPVEPDALPFWTVDTVPAFAIGVLDGERAYEFTSIMGVTQLENGMIVVLDGRGESAYEFRFFDSAGRHIATHGRQGQGPGEFEWVHHFGGVGGDTVIAVDFSLRRISWLSASGGFLRSSMVDEARYKGLLGDDVANIAAGLIPLGGSRFATRVSLRREGASTPFVRFTQYDLVDTASGAATHIVRHDEPVPVRIQLSTGISYTMNKMDASIGVHVVDRARQRMCAGGTGLAQLDCASHDGSRRSIRWQPPPVPFTADDRRQVEDQIRANVARSRTRTAADADRIIDAYVWPTHFSPIRALQIDVDGNVWVLEQMRGPGSSLERRFRILNPDGEQIAFATEFPVSSFQSTNALFIGSAAVVRRFTDADGVERIGVFPIRK
jgi:hypothetical protein